MANQPNDDRPQLLPEYLPPTQQNTPEQRYIVDDIRIPPEQGRGTGYGAGCGAGCGWGLAAAGGCMVLLLLALFVPVILGLTTFNSILGDLRGIFTGEPRTATVITSQTVVTSVQPLGQLVSISAQLAKADIQVTVRDGFQNACGRTANHVAQGTVEAGIDLTQLTEQNVSYDALSETYTITLPPPQLTSCRIDFIQQYERSTSACGASWDNIRLLGNYTALVEFRDDAIEGGILDRAQREAEITLQNFLQLATGRTIEIEFAQPADPVLPPSCQPDPPFDWVYDPETNIWRN